MLQNENHRTGQCWARKPREPLTTTEHNTGESKSIGRLPIRDSGDPAMKNLDSFVISPSLGLGITILFPIPTRGVAKSVTYTQWSHSEMTIA